MKRILICFLLFLPVVLQAQVLNHLQGTFNAYHQNLFQEKIFVHTDKEQYVTGEILWFKIYAVDASSNQASDLSKVAYVELLDQSNQPIIQAKIALKNGRGDGSLYVPLSAGNGSYKFRTYTTWMRNFGSDYFFEKHITLINPLRTPEKIKKSTNGIDLQFFAEGGEMVEGLTCNMGIKAIDPNGKGVNIRGVVINQQNDTVARFQTLKFGIGHFKFTPLAQHTYKLIATTDQKEILIKDLPNPKKQGYSLFLADDENGNLILHTETNINAENVYLLTYQGQKIATADVARLTNGKAAFKIDKSKLNDGVSHLTLFNEGGTAIAERLYFKRPIKNLKIIANADATAYKTREKVTVTVQTNTENYDPLEADVSIAIKRLDSLQGMDQTDIVSYFWLSSALKGAIESPGYYFRNPTTETEKALDNLILTQGWRRMSWDSASVERPSLKLLPEFNGHIIKGKTNTPYSSVYLTVSNTNQKFYPAQSDGKGEFLFNTADFYGQNEIIVQTNVKMDSTSTLSIESPFSEQYTPFSFPAFEIKPSQLNELQAHSMSMQVQNVFLAEQLKKTSPLLIDSTVFYTKPFKTYKLDDYVRFNLMEDVLREYVRETFISKNGKNFVVNVLGETKLLSGEPLVLVDGAPYFNMDRVMEIDPKKIEKLEIVNYYYFYNGILFNGILNFSSYKPNVAALEINPNALVLDYEGMQLQREFYSPTYDSADKKDSKLPDFRNLLFWSPSTLTDKKGSSKVSFYTSDQVGTYIGVINGLSATGVPGNGTFMFEVKP